MAHHALALRCGLDADAAAALLAAAAASGFGLKKEVIIAPSGGTCEPSVGCPGFGAELNFCYT